MNRKFLITILSTVLVTSLLCSASAVEAANTVTLNLSGKTSNAKVIILVNKNNQAAKAVVRSNIARLRVGPAGTLAYLTPKGKVGGPVLLAVQYNGVLYSVSAAQQQGICRYSSAKGITWLKNISGPISMNLKIESGWAYPLTLPNAANIDTGAAKKVARLKASTCAPQAAGTLGLKRAAGIAAAHAAEEIFADSADPDHDTVPNAADVDDDNDGFIDAFDIDNDNDGILDNDDLSDSDRPLSGAATNSFWLFSNFHRDFQDSFNVNAMTVTTAMVDSALSQSGGLAIQVIDGGINNVELDCGSLSYCRNGGTGRLREPYPNGLKFPEEADADSDGKGSVEPGSTGDFQLAHNATSSEIKGGDVLIQEEQLPEGGIKKAVGMLNFVFHTTPAVERIAVSGGNTYDVTYPVQPGDRGTSGNCFSVPANGDVQVTVTAWRPQRRGIAAANEAAWMDMGNLRLIANIPNGPCVPDSNGQCSAGRGPGLCGLSAYSNIDPAFSGVSDGLQDRSGDRPTSIDNTFTYTINLSACLAAASMDWNAGEKLMVPIQMMNNYGDNAAQNICFIR